MFQYISCYSLSRSGDASALHLRVSIHLMLLFIEPNRNQNKQQFLFQYISCYSLSVNAQQELELANMFQYISCYSLSLSKGRDIRGLTMFQYISCYSLSDTVNNFGCTICSFNTSHVTLYQTVKSVPLLLLTFQYISCYSLSSNASSTPPIV